MTSLKILIHEKEKPPVDDGSRPEDFKGELSIETMVVLERGTVSGDTSVMFRLDDGQGGHYVAQMTGNILRTAFGAFQGAHERFEQKRIKKN
jgi:hypothetical protein